MSEKYGSEEILSQFTRLQIPYLDGIAILIECLCKAIVISSEREDLDRNIILVCEALKRATPDYFEKFNQIINSEEV